MGVAGCVSVPVCVWGAQELPVDCSRLSGEYIEKHTHTHTSKGALHIVVHCVYAGCTMCAQNYAAIFLYLDTHTHTQATNANTHTSTILCTMHTESHSD